MNDSTYQILVSLATGYFVNLTTPLLIDSFKKVFQAKPELEDALKTAKTSEDLEKVFGTISALAGNGSLTIHESFLQALRDIQFDHQNGNVVIRGSKIHASRVYTGGTGQGQTEISNSVLKTQGAQVKCSGNGVIKMSGDAQINLS